MNNSTIQFLTVSEAQQKTGKSQSTIIRTINEYKGSKHVKKDGKKYLISTEILSQLFTNYSPTIHLDSQMNSLLKAKDETIEILKHELNQKDLVISNQSNQISELIERSRETNILMKSLQEQIKPLEIAQKVTTVNVKAERHTNTPLIMSLHAQGLKYSEIAEHLNQQGLRNQYGKKYTGDAIKTTVNRNKL
jgi:beta-phosphoglucomutase-like phosphatase (HAD superfamily)